MSKSVIIAPSILSADPGKFGEEIKNIAAAGADWIHIDVMDGCFVPPITFGDNIVRVAKRSCVLPLDVHLMICDPIKHIDAFADAGSSRIIVHQEACTDLRKTLEKIRSRNIAPAVSVKPKTPIETIFPVLDLCDLVLVMTVEPGWAGQTFIGEMLPKISALRSEQAKRNLKFHVEVDGGINADTAKSCIAAGANVLVAGSYVFGSSDRASAIKSLRQ